MKLMRTVNTSLSNEINQHEAIQKNIIIKILLSKRLLSDHLEIVEESLDDLIKIQKKTFNAFTFLKTSGLMATSFAVFFHLKRGFRYLIPALVGVVPILYAQKLINIRKNELLNANLGEFLKSLDHYENAIKKNLMFLNESLHLKSPAAMLKKYDKDNKFPRELVESIKRCIRILYDFTIYLENDYIIYEKFDLLYQPFESLEDCELMTIELKEIDHKCIKDFFNIFAYVQSQLLLRYSLIISSNLNEGKAILKHKFGKVTAKVNEEKLIISKFLEIISNATMVQQRIQKQLEDEFVSMPKELRSIKSYSINFSSKMLALALQSQHLDESVTFFADHFEHPDNKDTEKTLIMMDSIKNELSLCTDEFQRLIISYQKYLNMDLEVGKLQETDLVKIENSIVGKKTKTVTEADNEPQEDDFFVVDGFENDSDEESPKSVAGEEIAEDINSKLAKKYFKPVLTELRERIEVISEDMKEREKKVLKAKGQDFIPDICKKLHGLSDYEDSGSDDEAANRKRKLKINQKKYGDTREFLNSKQQINIFGAPSSGGSPFPPPRNFLNEDVLE